jgi:hypothetical protein
VTVFSLFNEMSMVTITLTIDVPTLSANIFVEATNRTNIHNKTGSMCQYSVYLMRCLWSPSVALPALTANISVAAINRTSNHKTGDMLQHSVYFMNYLLS